MPLGVTKTTAVDGGAATYSYKGFKSQRYIPAVLEGKVRIHPHETEQLMRMNDGEYKSFTEIADWIEANL